jgi:hypothetical protein
MADFLTRLVERTLGLSSTVRPDIPPTFAPEVTGPAPRDAPGAHPPTDLGHAGAREAEHGTDAVPHHETPPFTVSRTPDGSGGEPARGSEPPVAEDTEERWEIDRHSTVPGMDADEPSRGPGRPRPSSASVPPDVTVADTSPEAMRSWTIMNDEERPEAPPSASSAGSPSGRHEPRIEPNNPNDGPSSARLKRRPGAGHQATPGPDPVPEGPDAGRSEIPTVRGEPASPGRRTDDPADAVESLAPPAEGVGPELRAGLDRARSGAPDRLVSQTGRRGAPGQASGREGHERGPDPVSELVADPLGRRPEKPAAPEREEVHPDPLRRAVPQVPLVPATNRPRGVARGREVRAEVTSPTIRVTIGRVEVRAVAPPPPQQPQPMREPSLSLEDYLKQHAGGRG